MDLEKVQVHGSQISFPPLLPSCLSILQLFNTECSQELTNQLVSIPPYLFGERNLTEIPQYLVDHIEEGTLTELIISLIKNGSWNQWTAPSYIQYCTDHQVSQCKEDVIRYIFDKDLNGGAIYVGINYLKQAVGVYVLLNDVLPRCDSNQILESLAGIIPFDIDSEALDARLWEEYTKANDMCWLELLLKRGNINALSEYYRIAVERMTLPDMTDDNSVSEVTESIIGILNPEGLSLIIQLLKLSFDLCFRDKPMLGLRYICTKTIINIGNSYYIDTLKRLEDARLHDDTPFDIELLDLIRSIESNQRLSLDVPMSFEEALILSS